MGAPKWTAGRWNWWTSNSWRRLRSEVSPGVSTNVLWPFTNPADGHADIDVTKEDMALISAAPDLAEAAEPFAAIDFFPDAPSSAEAIKVRVSIEGTAYETFLTIGDFRRIRAALSKARGETP